MINMIKLVVFLVIFLVSPLTPAMDDCAGTQTDCVNKASEAGSVSQLPDEALAEVEELRVEMRYFMAIGMHKKSDEKRDAIAALYEKHGASLPDEYRK